VNRIAAVVQLIPRESVDLRSAQQASDRAGLDYEYNAMRDTPYVMRRRLLRAPSGLPCTPPPFGAVVAVDMDTGSHLWEVPLGSMAALAPPGVELPREWGSVNLGGPIVTAGGLVFIGAALDRSLRALDIETGEELWRGSLPASGRATPMTYQLPSGRQLVAIAVGGGDAFGEGDHVVVFGLPR
jgi:quinoprotein glucose dehydrogenase